MCLQVVFSVLLQILLAGTAPNLLAVVGMVIIIVAGVWAVVSACAGYVMSNRPLLIPRRCRIR
jgi:uncharacterized membrane protein